MRYTPPAYLKPKAKVLIGMSGGIDSAIATYLLQKSGFECIGIYMKYWTDPKYVSNANKSEITNKCCSLVDFNAAKNFAYKLGIPFYTLNFRAEFKKTVVDEFITTFSKMQTPNPCVTCNQKIKFGIMLKKMQELGADYFATGHYARISKKKNEYELHEGVDQTKDQSYFLHNLNQKQLAKIILPLGNFAKEKVKKYAAKLGFNTFITKKESTGVCFYPDKNYVDFLRRYLPQKYFQKGNIVNLEGEILGQHNGLMHYTIGQRKGVLVGGQNEPIYVIGFNLKKNQLILGPDTALWKSEIQTIHNHFISSKIPSEPMKIDVRIRHLAQKEKAVLEQVASNKLQVAGNRQERLNQQGTSNNYLIKLKTPLRAITPGQFAVYYQGEKVIGGGMIIS